MKLLAILILSVIALYAEENRSIVLPYENGVAEGQSVYLNPAQKVDVEAERAIQQSNAAVGANGGPMHSFKPMDVDDSPLHEHKGHP